MSLLKPAAFVGAPARDTAKVSVARVASAKPSMNDDLTLMGLVARGDPAAQRVLVRRLLRRIERVCRALLRNRQDAEDATQLSVLEVIASARNFRGESSLERWSDRITARTALRAAARERRAQRPPIEDQPSVTQATSEHALLAREFLDQLPERQRTVLVMRSGLEYSVEEIAEIAGISPNSVKDRLLRGRTTLRRMMRGEKTD